MTVLVTADLHLSENLRDAYRLWAMGRIAQLIEQYHVETLLILGDLTEEKDFHSASLTNTVVEIMFDLSCLCKVMILRGNHDYTREDCPYFHFLRRLEGVAWINQPCARHVAGLGNCLFLPHTRNHQKDWVSIGLLDKPYVWTFAHNTFAGALTEHGKRLSGIPTSIFPRGTCVISGDIHVPQTLGPVTYVGSPYSVDFGDEFEPRLLLLSGGEMESIPFPGPQKRLLTFSKGYDLTEIKANPGDLLKVRYQLASDERENWPEIKATIRQSLAEMGLDIHLIQPLMEMGQQKHAVAPVRKTDEALVQQFAAQAGVSDPVLETGLQLLQKA